MNVIEYLQNKGLGLFIRKSTSILLAQVMLFGVIFAAIPTQTVHAGSLTPGARVTFTFDDGLASGYTDAAPTLQKYGFTAEEYVPTSCIGSTGTCPENPSASYMTWPQVQALQNTYGWEIGSHSITTPCLASNTQPDCPNTSILTTAQVMQELTGSQSALQAQGLNNINSFATPFGDWTPPVLADIAKVYASHRPFQDSIDQTGPAGVPDGIIDHGNTFPYNDYLLYDLSVQAGVTVAQVENYINQTVTNKQWLIMTFHDIKPVASTNPTDYEYNTADLDQIAAYVKSLNIPVVTMSGGLVTNAGNLLPNSSFDTPISSSIADPTVWSTDDPTDIKQDTGNNGNYPSPTNSVSLTGTTKNIELFSPQVPVSAKPYVLKNFLNVTNMTVATGHEIDFYIDEYDANGTYLQTQFKKSEVGNAGNPTGAWVENMNFEYTPTSATVAKARLQVVVTANSGAKAYLDNAQWFAEDGSTTGGVGAGGKPGDVNGDGLVNALDLSIMLSNWGKTGATHAQGDLSGDGVVNALDLSILLTNWGK
jgi:peptidoglycan/xylan/chitin deacetylase (PgdA/CDA1 family)